MNQRRIQPPGMGTRVSPFDEPDDHAADLDFTISIVIELNHEPDQWRGSFAFYTGAIMTSRDIFGNAATLAGGPLSLWRYPFPSLADLN